MTFSAKVKAELCKAPVDKQRILLAEICGMFLYANRFSAKEIRITTENTDFVQRASRILKVLFGFDFDRKIIPSGRTKKYSLGIINEEKIATIFDAFGLDAKMSHTVHLNSVLVEDDKTRAAFLRGAFLSGGSVIDPEREYHLEFVTSHIHLVREVSALLYELNIDAKLTGRKGNHILYFKDSGEIEELLTRMGAPVSAMAIMDAKMFKELRNSLNRKNNFEFANLSKTTDAALTQLEAIDKIEKTIGLDALPPQLYEVAMARRENPNAPLSELCKILGGAVTKSGINHRMRRIMEISKK